MAVAGSWTPDHALGRPHVRSESAPGLDVAAAPGSAMVAAAALGCVATKACAATIQLVAGDFGRIDGCAPSYEIWGDRRRGDPTRLIQSYVEGSRPRSEAVTSGPNGG